MELTRLPNIGQKLAQLLNEVGIQDSEELKEVGVEIAFLRLKAQDKGACFHKLIALEGAIQGECANPNFFQSARLSCGYFLMVCRNNLVEVRYGDQRGRGLEKEIPPFSIACG